MSLFKSKRGPFGGRLQITQYLAPAALGFCLLQAAPLRSQTGDSPEPPRPIVDSPQSVDGVLAWNTFIGGATNGEGYAIAVDGSGNVYASGVSDASWGSPIRGYTGGGDVFVAKLGSDGSLIWNTFLGGSGSDLGRGIVVDASGNVYVSGESQGAWGSPVRGYSGGGDVFVAKLGNDGSLAWNTFLGGGTYDAGGSIALATGGSVCVSGSSSGSWGAPIRSYTASGDAFAAKLASDGSLIWNTFLGGGSVDWASAIAVDPGDNAYVAGASAASWGSPVRGYSASFDAFAAKLGSDGSLVWNTFLGGSGDDNGYGIAADASRNSYVAGPSNATWGSPVRAYSAAGDEFAARLGSDGSLVWNTFLGGAGNEFSGNIALDRSGNVCVVANTNATWGSPVRPYTAGEDGWAAKVTSGGSLIWNTFLGGSDDDPAYGLAADGCGNLYLTGDSYATWGSPVSAFTPGFENVFVAKIASSDCPILDSIKSKKGKPGSKATLYGFNFSPDKSKNTVYFGKYKAAVKKATATSLQVTIPNKTKPGDVGVAVTVNTVKSNTVVFHIK